MTTSKEDLDDAFYYIDRAVEEFFELKKMLVNVPEVRSEDDAKLADRMYRLLFSSFADAYHGSDRFRARLAERLLMTRDFFGESYPKYTGLEKLAGLFS